MQRPKIRPFAFGQQPHESPQRIKKAPRSHVRSAWRIAQFCSGSTPTQSELRACGGAWWSSVRSRARGVRRDSGCPPCGRQSDVTGTVLAPVTSPHSKPGDVVTSPGCISAGRYDSSRTPASRPRRIGGQGPKRPPSSRRVRGNGAAARTQNGKQRPGAPLSRAERLDRHDMHTILARIRIGAEPLNHG